MIEDKKMPYDCLFNDLPEWMRHAILIEGVIINMIIFFLILYKINNVIEKYRFKNHWKRLRNEEIKQKSKQ